MNPNTVIVASPHMGRWSCAKIHIARGNGFTLNVWKRRNYLRSGTVETVEGQIPPSTRKTGTSDRILFLLYKPPPL